MSNQLLTGFVPQIKCCMCHADAQYANGGQQFCSEHWQVHFWAIHDKGTCGCPVCETTTKP